MRHTALLLVAALLCWLVDARTEADKTAYSSGQVVDDALADQVSVEEMQKQVFNLQKKVADLKSSNTELRQDLAAKTTSKASLVKKVDAIPPAEELEAKVADQKREQKSLRITIDSTEASISNYTAAAEQLNEKIDVLGVQVIEKQNEKDKHDHASKLIAQHIAALEKRLAEEVSNTTVVLVPVKANVRNVTAVNASKVSVSPVANASAPPRNERRERILANMKSLHDIDENSQLDPSSLVRDMKSGVDEPTPQEKDPRLYMSDKERQRIAAQLVASLKDGDAANPALINKTLASAQGKTVSDGIVAEVLQQLLAPAANADRPRLNVSANSTQCSGLNLTTAEALKVKANDMLQRDVAGKKDCRLCGKKAAAGGDKVTALQIAEQLVSELSGQRIPSCMYRGDVVAYSPPVVDPEAAKAKRAKELDALANEVQAAKDALAASNATENKTAQGVDRKRLAQAERDLEEAKAVDSDERNYTMQKRSVALVSDLLYRKAHTGKEIARAHTLMGALAGFKGKIAKNCTKGALGVIRKKVEEPTIPKAVDHNRVKTLMATMLVKANITNATKIAKMKALVADLACANDAKMKKLVPSSPEAIAIAEKIKAARQAANDTCEDAISLTQRVPELEAMNRKPQDVAKAMDVAKKKREECDDAKMLVDKLMGDFELQQNKTEEARKAEVARKASLDKLIKDMYDKADLEVKNATMKAQEEKAAVVAKEKAQQKAVEEGDDDAMNATLSPPSYNGSVYINGTQFPAHVVPANSTVRTYPNGTTVLILRNGSKQELNMTEVMAQYGNQSSAEAARWKRLHERDEDAAFENDISQEATEAKKIQSDRESVRQKMLNNGSASNASQIPSESLAAIIKRLKKKSNCSGETPSGDKKDEVDEKNAARKALMQKARDALKEEPPKESSEGLFSLSGASFLELAHTSTREDKKALYTTAQKKQKNSNHSKHNATNSSRQRNASKAPLTPEPTDAEMFKSIMNAPADVRQAACAGNKDCLSVIEAMRDAQLAASNTTERIERLSSELMSVSSDPELSFNEPDRNHTARKKVSNANKTLSTPKPPPPPLPVKNCTCDDNVADLAGMEEMNDEGVTSPDDEEATARNLAKDPECFKFCANRLVKAKEEATLTKKVAEFKGLAKEFNIKVGCNGSSSDGANCSGVKDPEPAYAGVQKVQRIKEFLRHLHSPAGRVALAKQKDVKAKPKSTEKALAPEEIMDAGNSTADKEAREEIKQVAKKKAEAKKKAAAAEKQEKQEMEEKDTEEDQNSKADAKESSEKSNNDKSKSSKTTASKTGPKVNVTKYESRIASLESEIQRLKTERAADQEKHSQAVTKHETELALLKQKQDNATKETKREKKQITDTDGMSPMEKKIQREIEISELKEQLHEAEADASNASAEVSASADNKTSASATLNESNVTATANETKSTETEEEQDKELDSLDETETVANVSADNTTNVTKAKAKAAKPVKKNATATAVLSKMGAIFSVKKGNLTNKLHKFAARLKMRPNATMNASNSAEVIAQAKLFRRMKSMLDNNGTALSAEDEIRLDETAEVTENIKASLPGVSSDAAEKVASLIDNAMKKAVTLSEQEKTRKKEAAEAEAAEAAAKAALTQAEALKANETAKEALKQAAEEAEDERLANAVQEKVNQTGNSSLDREEETPKAPGKESDRVYINIKNSSSLVNQGLLPANAKGDVWLWVKKFSKAKKSLSEAAAEVKTAEAAGNNAAVSGSGSKASSMSFSGSGSAEPLVPKSMSGSGSTSGSSSASISASGSGSTSGSSSGNGSASGSGSAAEAQAVKAKAAEKVAAAKKKLEETTDPVEKTKVEEQLKAAEEQSKVAEENATKVEVSVETPADKAAKTAEKAVNATKAAAAKAKAEAAKAAKAAGSGNKKCQKFTTCGACGLDPACGWCATDNKCYGGDADGPNKAVCDNWVHHNCPAANETAANQADAPTASVSDSGDASGSGSNSSSESTSVSGSGSAEVAANSSAGSVPGSASGMGSDSVSTNATATSASSAISGSGSALAPSSNSSSGLSGSGMSTAVSSSISASFSGSDALPSAAPAASAAAGASNNTATSSQQ